MHYYVTVHRIDCMEGCNWCPTLQYYVLISQVGHPDMIEGSVSTNKYRDQHQARGQGMVTGLSNQDASLGTTDSNCGYGVGWHACRPRNQPTTVRH